MAGTPAFGMVVQSRSEHYALVADPVPGFKIELNRSDDGEARFRHLGFRTADVDGEHRAPHRRDFARMRTSFLREANGLAFQFVKYDE